VDQYVRCCILTGIGLTAVCCSTALGRVLWKQAGKSLVTQQLSPISVANVAKSCVLGEDMLMKGAASLTPKLAQPVHAHSVLPPLKPAPLTLEGMHSSQMVTKTASPLTA